MSFAGYTEIYEAIDAERGRQEGLVEANDSWMSLADPDTPDTYRLAVLGEEFGEVCHELVESNDAPSEDVVARVRTELVQLAAVAVAWIEGIDAGWRP